ncbi:MAG: M14 family metallopeptidase [Bacteroidota bacterium]
MKKFYFLLPLIVSCSEAKKYQDFDFTTTFETSKGFETATYPEVIDYYKALAETYKQITIDSLGNTDSGEPLHYVTYNPNSSGNDYKELRKENAALLINNGIHPGESDGIDATMMLFRDLVDGIIKAPENVVIVTIPVYNVGGSLNRNTGTRTNQNGPLSYGFRGNAQNFDLNRDFIKSDTKNTEAFAQIFHHVKPDVFIDNHVSNGADYQYTLTHLFTQHNKLSGPQGAYLQDSLIPKLEGNLISKNWDITPYVNVFNRVPETGFSQFMDYPRYSTGYTTLFNTLGMMVETHMLKPYKMRVDGTYELMKSMIEIVDKNSSKIKTLKKEQLTFWKSKKYYPTKWELDTTKFSILNFKGYEGTYQESKLTGHQRLKYDRSKPFTKPVEYSNYFKATDSIEIPKAYIIPRGWHQIIGRLKDNSIDMRQFKRDTVIKIQQYRIEDYKSRTNAYEGHFPHYNTAVSKKELSIEIKKGDYYIPTSQFGMRYLIETLEPMTMDSFFNWNFFDTILQQKEGFSPYVWEDRALELLRANPKLQIRFNTKKTYDKAFAKNWYAQLNWLHQQSKNYEEVHMRYPVYRVMK